MENEEYVLLVYNDDWADEMDIFGWAIWPAKVARYLPAIANALTEGGVWENWVGTNEEIQYRSGERLLATFRQVPITAEQAKMLVDLFDLGAVWIYGHFPPMLDDLTEVFGINEADWPPWVKVVLG